MPDSYVIFTGRPNAGKSTAIKALTGLKVRTGKKPGTTTRIQKFPIARELMLVDMPGYGRRVGGGKGWEDRTKDMILDFIEDNRGSIVASVHVVNIGTFIETTERLGKKGFINLDVEMIRYINDTVGDFPLVAANKIDRSSEADVTMNLDALVEDLMDSLPGSPDENIYPVSLKLGVGVGSLKQALVKKIISLGWGSPFEYIR